MTRTLKHGPCLIIAISLSCGFGCRRTGLAPGQPMPALRVTNWTNGPAPATATLRGKVVVVDFFATWCVPCVAHTPQLIEVHERYHERGVVFLSITDEAADATEKIQQFAEELKIPWPIAYGGREAFRAFQVMERPITFVVARDGTITWQSNQVGTLDGAIRQVL